MRVVVTGAAGFIGGAVARQLRARGDQVLAIVRDPARAASLTPTGVELVAGDLGRVEDIAAQLAGADALIHMAGSYRVGIPASERPAMLDANVGATTRVLDAAALAGTPRIVHTSTVNVFGNTHGVVVDETYQRNLAEGFLSWYDETKYRAHQVALARIGAGAPILIVQPSGVYGQGDHTAIRDQLARAYAGTLPYLALGDLGIAWVYIDDLADGVVRALDQGRLGESYVLSGPCHRLRDALTVAARLGGKRPPRLALPTALLRALVPLNRRLGALGGLPANLAEVISVSAGVTYWASAAKAERELGFQARDLESGLRAMFAA